MTAIQIIYFKNEKDKLKVLPNYSYLYLLSILFNTNVMKNKYKLSSL